MAQSTDPLVRLIVADTTVRDEFLVERDLQRVAGGAPDAPLWRMDAAPPPALARAAASLARIGVDVVEAGFPCASKRAFEYVEAIAAEFAADGPVVSAVLPVDGSTESIDHGWAAVREAARPRLHLVVSTDHATDADGYARPTDELVRETRIAIQRARQHTDDVEFSPAQCDAPLAGLVAALAEAAVDAGATTVNIRTVPIGTSVVMGYRDLLAGVLDLAPGLRDVTISADAFAQYSRGETAATEALGCALVAIELGARQIKCALHGVSATPGHVPLERLSNALQPGRLSIGSWVSTGIKHGALLEAGLHVAGVKGYSLDGADPVGGPAW